MESDRAPDGATPPTLMHWIEMFHEIYYPTQNLERSWPQIFAHLVEIAASLSKAIVRTSDPGKAERDLARLFAWYCALCDLSGIFALDKTVFEKFPMVCPYCLERPCECRSQASKGHLDWSELEQRAFRFQNQTPTTLRDWQKHFAAIYPQSDAGGYAHLKPHTSEWNETVRLHSYRVMSRLLEELGETSSAIRLRQYLARNLEEEFADVFAWICAIANVLADVFESDERTDLEAIVWNSYPGLCRACGRRPCHCYEPISRGLVMVDEKKIAPTVGTGDGTGT